MTIVFDRHPSLCVVVEQVYDKDRHAYCYWNVKENFCIEFKKLKRGICNEVKDDAKKLLDVVCYTRFDIEFTKAMEKLRIFHQNMQIG